MAVWVMKPGPTALVAIRNIAPSSAVRRVRISTGPFESDPFESGPFESGPWVSGVWGASAEDDLGVEASATGALRGSVGETAAALCAVHV
ncbi:hypothetical protein GCM10009672_14590 [Nesterenkonia lutea]